MYHVYEAMFFFLYFLEQRCFLHLEHFPSEATLLVLCAGMQVLPLVITGSRLFIVYQVPGTVYTMQFISTVARVWYTRKSLLSAMPTTTVGRAYRTIPTVPA